MMRCQSTVLYMVMVLDRTANPVKPRELRHCPGYFDSSS
jgi:hypothetical protein